MQLQLTLQCASYGIACCNRKSCEVLTILLGCHMVQLHQHSNAPVAALLVTTASHVMSCDNTWQEHGLELMLCSCACGRGRCNDNKDNHVVGGLIVCQRVVQWCYCTTPAYDCTVKVVCQVIVLSGLL